MLVTVASPSTSLPLSLLQQPVSFPPLTGPVECEVQVRAHGGIAPAVAEVREGTLVATLRQPLRGVATGQTMVLYRPDPDGDEVLASATIAVADGQR